MPDNEPQKMGVYSAKKRSSAAYWLIAALVILAVLAVIAVSQSG